MPGKQSRVLLRLGGLFLATVAPLVLLALALNQSPGQQRSDVSLGEITSIDQLDPAAHDLRHKMDQFDVERKLAAFNLHNDNHLDLKKIAHLKSIKGTALNKLHSLHKLRSVKQIEKQEASAHAQKMAQFARRKKRISQQLATHEGKFKAELKAQDAKKAKQEIANAHRLMKRLDKDDGAVDKMVANALKAAHRDYSYMP